MRKELFYDPLLLAQRIGEEAARTRRFKKLKNSIAKDLDEAQISTLEFLEAAKKNYAVKTIFDIGANEGAWTLLAKAIFPDATIHAFEPLLKHQVKYLDNSKSLSNIHLHRFGLGAETKSADFNVAGHASSFLEIGSRITEMHGIVKEKSETIQMVALDDYVKKNHLPWPDLMKLDIEGYELEALKGATECMKHSKGMILEVSFEERHIGQPLFAEVTYFLYQHGFHVGAFMTNMPLGKEVIQADVYYIKK